jgi:hypothetical protein
MFLCEKQERSRIDVSQDVICLVVDTNDRHGLNRAKSTDGRRKMDRDLTVSEVLVDPLIAQLRKADLIGNAAFAQLLESAARVQARRSIDNLDEERASAFYCAIEAANRAELCVR